MSADERRRSSPVRNGSPPMKGKRAAHVEQKVWHINPMLDAEDPDAMGAAEEDEDFKESLREARMKKLSHSPNIRRPGRAPDSPEPFRLEPRRDSVPLDDYKIRVVEVSPRHSVDARPSLIEMEQRGSLSSRNGVSLLPPTRKAPGSPGSPMRRSREPDELKRSSRSAVELVNVEWGTKCPLCKMINPGPFARNQQEKCARCMQLYMADRLAIVQCQACLSWLEAKNGGNVQCDTCRNWMDVFPLELPEDLPNAERASFSDHSVNQGALGLADALTHGLNCILPKKVRGAFQTWSGNIRTDFEVMQPATDDEIRVLIFQARAAGLTLRVAGHGHSQAPSVCNTHEPGVLLMGLSHYSQSGIPDFQWLPGKFRAPTREVRINAGWSLSQLYKQCTPCGYFLFSQTAANPFTVGGMYMNAVHGATHDESFLSSRVTALRVIKWDGTIATITREEELRMWRSSMGSGGVVTHITVRLQRYTSLKNAHVMVRLELTRAGVQECVMDVLQNYAMCEFFFDPYENSLLIARWNGENDPEAKSDFEKLAKKQYGPLMKNQENGLEEGFGGPEFVNAMSLKAELEVFARHQRSVRLATLKQAFEGLHYFLMKDANGPNTMFAVEWATQCVFMAYYIPINGPDDVLSALNAVIEVHKWSLDTNQIYGLDSPIEFRFVRGNSNAVFTPLWEPAQDEKSDGEKFVDKQLYMNIEIVAYVGRIDPTFSKTAHVDNAVTASFQEFWYRVEQNWRKIAGAKPHLAKLFGLEPRKGGGYRAFAPQYCHDVWNPQQKRLIGAWLNETDPHKVFYREYFKNLLSEKSELDQIEVDVIRADAVKVPDAVHSKLQNINDLRGCWFLLITLPYWLSGLIVHSLGLVECVVLIATGLFESTCAEQVYGLHLRDCSSVTPSCTTMSMWFIRAWFLWRGGLGLFVAPFHMAINFRRIYLRCQNRKIKEESNYFKPNNDDNSKMFWRCVPICDIFIAFTLGLAMVGGQHMPECGLTQFAMVEGVCMLYLVGILASRMFWRLKGQYYRVFHFDGDGSFFAQNKLLGSLSPCKLAPKP